MRELKPNEARPLLRMLAGLTALLAWAVGILVLAAGDCRSAASMLLFALAFSYVAIAGYMPKALVSLFSRGGKVTGYDEMK